LATGLTGCDTVASEIEQAAGDVHLVLSGIVQLDESHHVLV
jgi:hypothetical protein